jgi:hypothetical protein
MRYPRGRPTETTDPRRQLKNRRRTNDAEDRRSCSRSGTPLLSRDRSPHGSPTTSDEAGAGARPGDADTVPRAAAGPGAGSWPGPACWSPAAVVRRHSSRRPGKRRVGAPGTRAVAARDRGAPAPPRRRRHREPGPGVRRPVDGHPPHPAHRGDRVGPDPDGDQDQMTLDALEEMVSSQCRRSGRNRPGAGYGSGWSSAGICWPPRRGAPTTSRSGPRSPVPSGSTSPGPGTTWCCIWGGSPGTATPGSARWGFPRLWWFSST